MVMNGYRDAEDMLTRGMWSCLSGADPISKAKGSSLYRLHQIVFTKTATVVA